MALLPFYFIFSFFSLSYEKIFDIIKHRMRHIQNNIEEGLKTIHQIKQKQKRNSGSSHRRRRRIH